MSKALIVRDGEIDKRFLDRVIAYAIAHNLVPSPERATLARRAAEMHQNFCAALGLNYLATEEALFGAKLIHNLISLGLEIASAGNIIFAAQVLRHASITVFIDLARARLNALQKRIEQSERKTNESFEINTAWGCDRVDIEYRRPLVILAENWGISVELTLGICPKSQLNPAQYRGLARLKLYELVATTGELGRLEQLASYLDFELRVSMDYLPWEALKSAARLGPSQKDTLLTGLEIKWTISTMLVTLAVTARLNTRGKYSPIISWVALRRFIGRFGRKGFNEESIELLRRYFAGQKPAPQEKELTVLLDVAEWSLDRLIFSDREESEGEIVDWYDRFNLRINSREVYRQISIGISRGGECTKRAARREPIRLDELELIAANKPASEFRDALVHFDWSSLKTDDHFQEFVETVPPKYVVELAPVTLRFVVFMVGRGGWDDWELKDKRALIGRLLKKWRHSRWQKLSQTVIEDVVEEATLAQAARLSEIIGRKLHRKNRRGD